MTRRRGEEERDGQRRQGEEGKVTGYESDGLLLTADFKFFRIEGIENALVGFGVSVSR